MSERASTRPSGGRRPSKRRVPLEPFDCEQCGQTHLKCRGHRKGVRPMVPCGANPRDGATVCVAHGGRAGQVVAAAERRVERALAVRSAQEALEFRGSTLPADDLSLVDALTEEYRRTVLLVRHFHGVVSALEEDASGGRLAPVWELYRAERAHLAQLAVAMARLGLEERRVAIDEALADDLVATMDAAFDALGLTVEQRLVAVEAMARARAGRG